MTERNDVRLIERWLPIAAIGEESARERRSMTALPPIYYLHVWWARRPLVASRAAILASLLPADADRSKFMRALGIHGDPVATRLRIDRARKTGEDLGLDPYGYPRAFKYLPTPADLSWLSESTGETQPIVLDPTAGGGSIPFEAARLGLPTTSNDLNPVAALLLHATVRLPVQIGSELIPAFEKLGREFISRAETKLKGIYPVEPDGAQVLGYLWARTINCPYCDGLVPLSPNWRLSPDGTGVRLAPKLGKGPRSAGRVCEFEIVESETEQSAGTVSGGDATCPYPDCARFIDGDEVKRQAQAGKMGEQLYTVAYKRRIETRTKSGKRGKDKWQRGYRALRREDDVSEAVAAALAEKFPLWEARDLVPTETIDTGNKTDEPRRYGMTAWRDMFSPRQLLGHGVAVEVYDELVHEADLSDETKRAALVYLALAIDSFINYGNRSCRWDIVTQRVRSIFDRHDFAFYTSYAEMAPVAAGLGFDWVVEKTSKCIGELIELARPDVAHSAGALHSVMNGGFTPPPVTISCKSGDALDHIEDASVNLVVMDPPYHANVMYAELSDFFYVWLKRTAGRVVPELFTRTLTDKDSEAVANVARFRDQKGAPHLATRDYQEKMARIFAECRRVLKPDGLMTMMFTHKATGAWDALTKGLMEAGFVITASWPIHTEAEGSLHIKDKAAAKSTIFLVCRPRSAPAGETQFWEDIEPQVAAAVRARIAEFEAAGIKGVDLYLAAFGPALEQLSRAWPLTRGTPRPEPEAKKRKKQADLFEEEFDPYAVTPEDALDAARREVKRWRLEKLTQWKPNADLDPVTAFFVLAWDAFDAATFPYDEALRLARAVGVDLDRDIVNRFVAKKGDQLTFWDSAIRVAKGALGPSDGSRAMIDALHHAAHIARTRTVEAARDMLKENGLIQDATFKAALEAVLEVLPPSARYAGFDLKAGASADDFDALETLRRIAFAETIGEPEQLKLFREEAAV